jgi:hypothetical protein
MKKEKKQNWYFTFGSGQPNDGKFIKFYGTFEEARQKMWDAFGAKWSMQYSEEQWNNPREDSLRFNNLDPKKKPTMADVWGWQEVK